MADMRLFFAEADPIKRDEIAARQLFACSSQVLFRNSAHDPSFDFFGWAVVGGDSIRHPLFGKVSMGCTPSHTPRKTKEVSTLDTPSHPHPYPGRATRSPGVVNEI